MNTTEEGEGENTPLNTKLLTLDVKIDRRVSNVVRVWEYKDSTVLSVIITNLLSCYRKGQTLVYSRDTSNTPSKKRLITTRRVISAVDWLHSQGYVINHKGKAHKRKEKRVVSRLEYTQKLLDTFQVDENTVVEQGSSSLPISCEVLYNQEVELVVLRDENKKPISFRMTKEVREMQQLVAKLNEINESVEVRDGEGNLLTNLYCRIFKDDFKTGGRYFRGDTLRIKNKPNRARLDITIDGEEVSEIDVVAMNAQLCGVLAGLNWLDLPDDPYTLMCDEEDNEVERHVAKHAMLMALNCESDSEAEGAIRKEIRKLSEEEASILPTKSGKEWLRRVKESFPEVGHMMCNENCFGMKLQYLDSQVATKVLSIFVEKGIPILPIHDSFVVQRKHEDLLLNILGVGFRQVVVDETDYEGYWPLTVTRAYRVGKEGIQEDTIIL